MDPILSKGNTPRMPWRDIAVRIIGNGADGLKKHFIEYWNFYNLQF
jgi:phosphatidylserine/phosphatidylglycerophosphate/cardiolipin synthase-like enzyme